jgi:hypothetical protein
MPRDTQEHAETIIGSQPVYENHYMPRDTQEHTETIVGGQPVVQHPEPKKG